MIIEVVGTQHVKYTRKDNVNVEGYQVSGVIIEDDYLVQDLVGNNVFTGYFSCSSLRLVPEVNKCYRIIKSRSKDSDGKDCDRYVDLVEV